MNNERMPIVIVGHVDHGKSTLIGRLFYDTNSLPKEKIKEVEKICKELGKEMELAFIMDHLQEEREQGITIDTAQTFFSTEKRKYIIIDAPGHKEFIKNMITGASQAEAAILIVDAGEGVQEQTKRHAYILGMLGLKQVIVVINKMDIINFDEKRFNEVKEDIIVFLKKINITPSYIIPISSKEGDNIAKKSEKMNWYKSITVLDGLDTFKTKISSRDKQLRFPVQDIYKIDNKRILVGRLESGVIKIRDKIIFLPSQKKTEVKTIEIFEEKRNEAEAGESIGITINDPLFIERGEIICKKKQLPKITNTINTNIFCMSKTPITTSERLLLRCATQEVGCKIKKIEKKIDSSSLEEIIEDKESLKETEVGIITLSLEKPIIVEKFSDIPELGRFVIEKDYNTVAGGIIV